MPNLLYPAYQKFYSSLSNLERFNKENNFFENISSLDSFFSEFRNITFVLKKSLAHTEYISIYYKNHEKYLSDLKWFVEKRNETIKQQPFQLIKQIQVTVYLPSQNVKISEHILTVENDMKLSDLIDELKTLFDSFNLTEVYFSAAFSFYEKNDNRDVYEEIVNGINVMFKFMSAIKEEINDSCELCNKIEKKLQNIQISFLPRDSFLVSDCVYYSKNNTFEKAGRLAMMLGNDKQLLPKMKTEDFCKNYLNEKFSLFEKFVIMNILIGTSDLMPTIMIVYKDGTYRFDTFHSDIKTTFYRKINETAEEVKKEKIQEVFVMQTYFIYDDKIENFKLTSRERQSKSKSDILAFMKVNCYLCEEEYSFDGRYIADRKYTSQKFLNGKKMRLEIGKINMHPIVEAFKTNT